MVRIGVAAGVACLLCACEAPAVGTAPTTSTIGVVAAENFWGSLATQLGGAKVSVQSVLTDPNADPHEYESSTDDARAFADAGLVILNGAGYDDWGQKLLDANPASGRKVLNVADLLGRKRGDNPHFWYDPTFVTRAADAITAAYKAMDANDAAYFDDRRTALTAAFQPYLDEVGSIKQRFAGTAIGSTESIFVYMAAALGVDLISPTAFMEAVSEGNDPPAAAVAEFQGQVANGRLRVLVYNSQTVTAVTTNMKDLAASRHIPTVGVTETLQPSNATFQEWQLSQLQKLEQALESQA